MTAAGAGVAWGAAGLEAVAARSGPNERMLDTPEADGRARGRSTGAPLQVIDALRAAAAERDGMKRRWSLSFISAATSAGPAGDLEQAMIAAGFDDTSPGLFGSGVTHPFSNTGLGGADLPWIAAIHYAFNRPWGAGIIVSDADIGRTFGYRNDGFFANSHFLDVNYGVQTIAPVLTYEPRNFVRIGGGPAYYSVRSGQEITQREQGAKSFGRLGFLADLTVVAPARSRLFFELRGQYRMVGSAEIGPFESNPGSLSLPNATLPAMKVGYDHWLVGVGFGFRF